MTSKAERDQRWRRKQAQKRQKHEQRLLRDEQAMAWHDAAVASGQKRYLARANNGELVSYLPEEYGVWRGGSGPVIQSVWGWIVLVGGLAFGLAMSAQAHLAHLRRVSEPVSAGAWIFAACALLFLAFMARYLVTEAKATILRRKRGLPTPSGTPMPAENPGPGNYTR